MCQKLKQTALLNSTHFSESIGIKITGFGGVVQEIWKLQDLMIFCLKTEKQKKENNRTGDVASPDWIIPIRVDGGCEPLYLSKTEGRDLKIPIR